MSDEGKSRISAQDRKSRRSSISPAWRYCRIVPMLLPNLTSPPFAASLAPRERARPERGLGLERRLWRSGRRCRPPRSAAQLRGHGTGVLGLALHAPEATGAAYLAASLCPPASGGWGLAPCVSRPKKAPIRESYELRSDYVLDRTTPSTHVFGEAAQAAGSLADGDAIDLNTSPARSVQRRKRKEDHA